MWCSNEYPVPGYGVRPKRRPNLPSLKPGGPFPFELDIVSPAQHLDFVTIGCVERLLQAPEGIIRTKVSDVGDAAAGLEFLQDCSGQALRNPWTAAKGRFAAGAGGTLA